MVPEIFIVDGIRYNAAEFSAYVVLKELTQIHDRGVVFEGGPAALATLGSAKIGRVTTGRLAARAVVLP